MKILESFDTKLDEHELYDAIQRCGQGNAILMKKHWIFLVRPMVWMMFAFIACGLLIYFSYAQFFENKPWLFRVISLLYIGVTLVRSLHSMGMILYDINLQLSTKERYIQNVEESDFKEGRYEKFLKHTGISLILQVLLMVGNSIISFYIEDGLGHNLGIFLGIIGVIVNIGFIFLLYKTLDRIIDYEMDFNIFTTEQFIIYRQHGFLKAESMNIATSTIKIVQESKSGFLGSLFGYGKVSIHPEGNLGSSKAIELFYVPETKMLTKKLNEFIDKSKEGMNISTIS